MNFTDAINLFDNAGFSRESRSDKLGGDLLMVHDGGEVFSVTVDETVYSNLVGCFFWVRVGVVMFGFRNVEFVLADVVLVL